MCGIAGIITSNGLSSTHFDALNRMQQTMLHRGPDGEGRYSHDCLAMGMRRLSIIDLAGGWQPFFNEEQSIVLIANGEIYNYIELREKLIKRGHIFKTNSDCETILHLYEEYGERAVEHLRGMFAFALWDTLKQRLVLARDRMGEKPLYLYQINNVILFASELKAIIQSGMVPFDLDPLSIDLYFHYQYIPEPYSPLKGVRKLPAAHLLLIDIDPWQIREVRYWNMEDAPPLDGNPTTIIRNELETISELIIRSDVPVGIALSGGLDSSAIATLVSHKYPGTMHAFTVGYVGRPRSDERAYASELAHRLEMPFHEIELDISDVVKTFPHVVYWRDDPIADISGSGYYSVMKLAREFNIPVMLQGQGSDELFWGYPWVSQAVKESRQKAGLVNNYWKALPSYFQFVLPSHFGPRTIIRWLQNWGGLHENWQKLCYHQSCPAEQMVFYDLIENYNFWHKAKKIVYTPKFREQIRDSQPEKIFTYPHPWPQIDIRMTNLICSTYLQENGITQGERLGMASSVELRLPFLDHKLVETVIGLRKSHSDYLSESKIWLKSALNDLVPSQVIKRPKRGFEPPAQAWYTALHSAYGRQVSEGYLAENQIIEPNFINRIIVNAQGQANILSIGFAALVLEMWCQQMYESIYNKSI